MTEPIASAGSNFPVKGVASGLRLIALIAFVMPFATASCGSQDLLTVNGIQAAFGTDYNIMGQAGHADGSGWFVLALLLIVGALVVGLLKAAQTGGMLNDHQLEVAAVVLGAVTVVILIIAAMQAGAQLTNPPGSQSSQYSSGGPTITVKWDFGFWLALLGIVLGSAVGLAGAFPSQFETQVAKMGVKMPGGMHLPSGSGSATAGPGGLAVGTLSPDGKRFWNGSGWEAVEAAAPPTASATPNRLVVGTLSPDGTRYWDGSKWTRVE